MVWKKEAVRVHQQVLKGEHEGESVVDGRRSQGARSMPAEEKHGPQRQGMRFESAEEKHSASKRGSLKQSKQCTRCGKGQHSWSCHRCHLLQM